MKCLPMNVVFAFRLFKMFKENRDPVVPESVSFRGALRYVCQLSMRLRWEGMLVEEADDRPRRKRRLLIHLSFANEGRK